MFNLFILDFFGYSVFGFRLSVHLDLTLKSGDQELLQNLCYFDKYSEGQIGLIRYCKSDFL